VLLPTVLPILPIESLIRYSNTVYRPPTLSKFARKNAAQAPWHFQFMLGWEDTVAQVAQAYQKLTPSDRAECAILAWTYWNAGAIDLFGPAYHLPKAISGHTGYYFWGPRDYSGNVVLSVGGDLTFLRQTFNSVEPITIVTRGKLVGGTIPIYLCKGIKRPLSETWPAFKYYFKRPTTNPITTDRT
jgi:hypothetical protein